MAATARGTSGASGASREEAGWAARGGVDQENQPDRGELWRTRSAIGGPRAAVVSQRLSGETHGSPPACGATAVFRSADGRVAEATGRGRGKAGGIHKEPRRGDGRAATRSDVDTAQRPGGELPAD